MTRLIRKGDLIRVKTRTVSGRKGVAVAAGDQSTPGPDQVIPFRWRGQPDDCAPSIALRSQVALVRYPANSPIKD